MSRDLGLHDQMNRDLPPQSKGKGRNHQIEKDMYFDRRNVTLFLQTLEG